MQNVIKRVHKGDFDKENILRFVMKLHLDMFEKWNLINNNIIYKILKNNKSNVVTSYYSVNKVFNMKFKDLLCF